MKKLVITLLILLTASILAADTGVHYDILSDTETRNNDYRIIRGQESSFWVSIGLSSYSIDHDDWFGNGYGIEDEGSSIEFALGFNKTIGNGGSLGISIFGGGTSGDLTDGYDTLDYDQGSIGIGLFIEGTKSGLIHKGYVKLISAVTEYSESGYSSYDVDQGIFILGYSVRKNINIGEALVITPQAGLEYRGEAIEDDYGYEEDYDGSHAHLGVAASYSVHENILLGAGLKYYIEFDDEFSSARWVSIDAEDTLEFDLGALFLINDKINLEIKYVMQEAGDSSGSGIFAIFSVSF